MRERVERVPVVVQGRRGRRGRAARLVWGGAEAAVTCGLVLLLLVVHQLWWTNRQAREGAERKVQALEREWGSGSGQSADGGSGRSPGDAVDPGRGGPGPDPAGSDLGGPDSGDGESAGRQQPAPRRQTDPAPRWDQAYAVLRIPRIGIRVPVAEGISKGAVLNKGYVGHYPRTAQPGQGGNFALAGHRNTHGEPFRRLDRLAGGDELVVETKRAIYTYVVDQVLARTSARDSGVIRAVPRSLVKAGHGYSSPGYYITLTTCTPEYTSKYRLIVWGKLKSMRPR
ncbi:hypothetical protein GCM10010277_15500 [Streptomyces longisporoflavus]|uniref:class E sortase n=1 Tax=Streptomyces longisporoflavus TaxID=28044 RepID=UPI00167D760F|nr:class E sortase [Streptomyces longisporoflavus]GGV31662.1 hypothetical protein GCM10010277_15500 [Streptomyces longisporoflavus]